MRTYPILLYPKPKVPIIYSPWIAICLAIAGTFIIVAVTNKIPFPLIICGLLACLGLCLWQLWQEYPRKLETDDRRENRGYAEFSQNSRFPQLLKKIFGDDRIQALRSMGKYTPDFAYTDLLHKLYIDIEIDEPYTPRQPNSEKPLIPTHYVGNDDRRDRFFQNAGWAVIRFSERQVLLHPDRCCKLVAELVAELTGNQNILSDFEQIPHLESEPQWTEAESRLMAIKQARLHYHEPESRSQASQQ
jgi:very-short-patch-repair endonuclease